MRERYGKTPILAKQVLFQLSYSPALSPGLTSHYALSGAIREARTGLRYGPAAPYLGVAQFPG